MLSSKLIASAAFVLLSAMQAMVSAHRVPIRTDVSENTRVVLFTAPAYLHISSLVLASPVVRTSLLVHDHQLMTLVCCVSSGCGGNRKT
eukprot:2875880-Rhodomonas_salina.1